MKRATKSALALTAILPIAGMFGGCASNSTGITPDYKNSETLLEGYGTAASAGKKYVRDHGVLPPVPLNIFALQEKMHQERADVDANWLRAYGFEWADDISEISEAGPAEQIAYGVAMLDAAILELKTVNPDAYKRAMDGVQRGYDRVFGANSGRHYHGRAAEHDHDTFIGRWSTGDDVPKHKHPRIFTPDWGDSHSHPMDAPGVIYDR